jgi:hypothetical protein
MNACLRYGFAARCEATALPRRNETLSPNVGDSVPFAVADGQHSTNLGCVYGVLSVGHPLPRTVLNRRRWCCTFL